MTPVEEAIVLAGGRGTRLQPVVNDVPKPLATVAGRPFLAWVLDHLAEAGIRRVVMASGYMAAKIEAVIGARWGPMAVEYSVEPEPLGTGGAVKLASRRLDGVGVHVLNGDTFLRYAPLAFEAATLASEAWLGVALTRVDDVSRYGTVDLRAGRVSRFLEKGGSGPGLINAGSYFLTADALAAMPQVDAFSLETGLLAPLAAQGLIAGYTQTGGFIDIGIPEDYHRAQALFGNPR